jgi:hypothetical protein
VAISDTETTIYNDGAWHLVDTAVTDGDEVVVSSSRAARYAFSAATPDPSVRGFTRSGGQEFAAKMDAGDKLWVRAGGVYEVSVSIKRAAA